ncbi:MAG: radical SAM protein [Thermodesulfobacteriota bacterium]
MKEFKFEQGPIRPPSEATSLLLRVTRNCPWNRCEFCHTYKGQKFQRRTIEEVKRDIDTMKETAQEVKSLSWQLGWGGEITPPLLQYLFQTYPSNNYGLQSMALWLYHGGKNVFLQDADSLILKTDEIVQILSYLKETFPSIERITTYARAKTISKKKLEDLKSLAQAGLTRIHIGLESGYDPLLQYIKKGVSANEHIEAGKKVKASGLSLSEYVILGLGGKKMWREHAVETARVLNQIDPDFIRVRTLKVLKGMPLYQKIEKGEFILLSEDEVVMEEKLFVENLNGINSFFVSDHILNLLEEVEGKLPEAKGKMLCLIDRYLNLPEEEKKRYRLGRRLGLFRSLDDLLNIELREEVERVFNKIQSDPSRNFDQIISHLMESFI